MKEYQIKTIATIYKTTYTEGEGDFVNSWDLSATIKANNALEAIESFFEKELFFTFKKEFASFGDGYLHYSNLVDQDNNEITEDSDKMQEFIKGKQFYDCHNSIKIMELVLVDLSNKINN